MFQASNKTNAYTLASPRSAFELSGALGEFLDVNHDAWTVQRNEGRRVFCREIGKEHLSWPPGYIVITDEPGKAQTLTLYHGNRKRCLVETYREELPQVVEVLGARERTLHLFNALATTLDRSQWDYRLSFCDVRVIERSCQLRPETKAFAKLVSPEEVRQPSSGYLSATAAGLQRSYTWRPCGITVHQQEHEPPVLHCSISYPRPTQLTFSSTRLSLGLLAITESTASMVTQLNEATLSRYSRFGESDSTL